MKKWEYCQIVWMIRSIRREEKEEMLRAGFDGEFIDSGDLLVARRGFVALAGSDESKTITSLAGTLRELGLDGWELVSHAEITEPAIAQNLWLKRPIVSEAEG